MITAGVDLSSQDAKTASCVVEWRNERATVAELSLGVYPAVALRRWGLPAQGYKGKDNAAARGELVARFRSATTWLGMPGEHLELCLKSDDAFDALIAALVARAAIRALVDPIPDGDVASARREGWIAVPTESSLARLA